MKSLQNLREQRADKAKEVRNLLDGSVTNWNKDTEAKVDGVYAEIANLDSQISRFEKALTLEDSVETRAGIMADRNGLSVDENAAAINSARAAFNAYCRGGFDGLADDQRDIVQAVNAAGRAASTRNVAASATAGVTIPTIIMPTAIEKLKAFGGMREVASQISTGGGGTIDWATYDDTSSTGELVGEATAAADDDLDSFGTKAIKAYKFSSKVVPISWEVLQDSAINVESVVTDALFKRIARAQNQYFTTGTGSSQPQGVVPAAAAGKVGATGQTLAVTYDDLVDLIHSVDPAYRIGTGVGFMFADSTLKVLKKLKDSAGRPLWLPGTGAAIVSAKDPDTLMGYRYTINQNVAAMAANAKSILFGDFSKYLIRDVMDMQLFRFADSAYAKKGQVGFLVWARADGAMIDASNESIRYYQNSAT